MKVIVFTCDFGGNKKGSTLSVDGILASILVRERKVAQYIENMETLIVLKQDEKISNRLIGSKFNATKHDAEIWIGLGLVEYDGNIQGEQINDTEATNEATAPDETPDETPEPPQEEETPKQEKKPAKKTPKKTPKKSKAKKRK